MGNTYYILITGVQGLIVINTDQCPFVDHSDGQDIPCSPTLYHLKWVDSEVVLLVQQYCITG